MDLRCPKCGEPWDADCLHDEAAHRQSNELSSAVISYETAYNSVSADFRRRGCAALTSYGATCSAGQANPGIAAVYGILGDDLDGAASIFEDLEFLDFDL